MVTADYRVGFEEQGRDVELSCEHAGRPQLRQFVENPRNIFPHLGHGHVATRIPQITTDVKIANSTIAIAKSAQ